MTDQEILELIERAPSDAWTVEQIESVRARLATSPELRRAMAERLRLDDVLSVAFAEESLSPRKIVAAAERLRPRPKPPRRPRRWPWGIVLSLILAGSVLAWRWWPRDVALVGNGNHRGVGTAVVEQRGGDRTAAGGAASRRAGERDRPEGRAPRTDEPAPRAPEPDDVPADARVASPPPAGRPRAWETEEQLGAPPRPFDDVSYVDVGAGPFTPRRDELRAWLIGLRGVRLDVGERDVGGRRCGAFDGVGRLAAPWPADAMLRMAMRDANKLRIYLWRGTRGVMLHYHEDQRFAWAAYIVTRGDDPVAPTSFALAATDDGRGYRTSGDGQATTDLYWRDGAIVLARGGIQLLAAPFDGPPDEVVLDGRACILGLWMTRASGLPPALVAPPPTIVEQAPAQRTWNAVTPAGARFVQAAEGYVELSSEKTKAASQAVASALPAPNAAGIYEITCRIDHATRGASLFVADEQGRTAEVLRLMRENRTGGVGGWFVNANDGRQDAWENLDSGPLPLVGRTTWIRIVAAGGLQRTWLSADGEHWASPWPPRGGVAPHRIGIALWPGESPRRIRLSQLAWRELSGLAALAPVEWIAQAGGQGDGQGDTPADAPDFNAWRQRALAQRPLQAPTDKWLRAAAVAALYGGASGKLAQDLVAFLIAETPRADLSQSQRVRALEELTLLCDTWEDLSRANAIYDAYAAIAKRPSVEGDAARPYSAVANEMLRSAVFTRDAVVPNLRPLARREILSLVDAGRWAELDALANVVRFRNEAMRRDRSSRDPRADELLVDWAQSTARQRMPDAIDKPRPATDPSWRGVLVEQFNTDAFNVMAEFQAAVDGQAYRDAAEIIATAGGKLVESTDAPGVLPDARDEGLYVSLRLAVEQAMRDHPGLESAMRERFGPTARLRVERAIAERNLPAIEAATLQYDGTVASTLAHLWLANRALATGRFARAERHFREAARSSDEAIAAEARDRLRLAAAMAQRNVGERAANAVTIGDKTIAAAEFERIVAKMQSRPADANAGVGAANSKPLPVAPAPFVAEKRGDFRLGPFDPPRLADGALGDGTAVDWFARCASLGVSGDTLVVNGRTSAVAFDTASGARRWEAALRNEPVDRSSPIGGSARPLLVGDRVYIRWFAKSGPLLVCLGAEDGRLVWQTRLPNEHAVVGDPFVIREELYGFVARPDALRQHWQVSLVNFDLASGEIVRTRPLVRLRETWRELGVCRATVANDRVFVSLGGVVLCADLTGQVHWVRSLPHVPPSVDAWSHVQVHDRPLVAGGRVYVAAPTVRRVVCLEESSGRLVWQHGNVDLVQFVGLWNDRIVLRDASGLVGLAAGDGSPQWRRESRGPCEVLLGGDGQPSLVIGESIVGDAWRSANAPVGLVLLWIDPATGSVRGNWTHPDWSAAEGRFGPAVVSSQGRMWGLWGGDRRGETREVVELFPPGVAVPKPAANEPAPGKSGKPAEAAAGDLQPAADKTLAGWTAESGGVDPSGTLVKHLESDDTVLAVADGASAVRFSRDVSIRPESQGRLRIKAGFVAGEEWRIHVAAGEKTLLDATIGGQPEPGWERFELELAPLAGHNATFVVTATSPDGRPRKTFWKRLEVTP